MRLPLRENAVAVAVALLGTAVVAWLTLLPFAWNDYDYEAAPAYAALVAGDVGRFLDLCPLYGGSLVLRSPFALAPSLWGGGELAVFRSVAVPCLLAGAALGVWLVAHLRALGQSRLARGTTLFLCVGNPVLVAAVELGHPEELLGSVLCVAAVLAAVRGRAGWAGLLLGLALGNKAWALLAVGPVLVALPAHRVRALLVAGAVAAVLTVPIYAEELLHPVASAQGNSATGTIFQPWQAFWFLGEDEGAIRGGDGEVKEGWRSAPVWLSSLTHPVIAAMWVPLTVLWVRARRGRPRERGAELLLLALLLHLRCLLDPWNNIYYALPFVFALIAWETTARRRPPVLALGVSALLWLTLERARVAGIDPDVQAVAYLAWAVPAALALAVATCAPGRALERASSRRGRACQSPAPRPITGL